MVDSPLSLTFIGTGGVRAAPLFGCNCQGCQQARQFTAFLRRPCSALIQCGNDRTLLDAGADLLSLGLLDADRDEPPRQRILLTHYHMDHVQGLFPLRWSNGPRIPVFSPPDPKGCDDLFKHPGLLDFQFLPTPFSRYTLGPLTVIPIPLQHSRLTWGYLIRGEKVQLAYLTDTRGLPERSLAFLCQQPLDGVIIDCTYPPLDTPDKNHNDINSATVLYNRLRPKRFLLTHIDHSLDEWLLSHSLPTGMEIAYDNQTIVFG
ncbi:phosphonate metabolism protein PhnP [Samsonia erythrinae]|uniref:5-phospho-alpha-D-ribosyl 1,2-cyclic phosphate phosphodiesterase n=1 Tax=Samsonia erythrinae TaxID=160434 RepID=A0A4R3VNK8_9GAMM|nr:phosphonate metabolism protein PhnP [Samsonia erythrinae]TCV08604.1 5-phospho-alpha-D-ribosyl 1,2-cyclic phosphate phosphodiesterase [Samsonia erythrinae]